MINFRFSTILAMGLIAATGIVSEAVAQQEREQVKLDPVRVSLFKNGYGYVTLRGKTGKSAAMEIHNLPVPTFGTFWMSAASPAKISCFVSSLKKYESNSLTATMADFARANPDSKVRVVTKNGSFEGTVIDTRPPESDPFPSQIIGEEVHQVGNYPRNGTGNSYLAVRTPSGIVVVADSEVIQLEFAGSNLLLPKRTTWKPVVELNLEKPTPDCVLTASCMTWGISWVPSYRLEMGAADKGVLSVKATVMNELMDLENVHLDLITGTPDLQTSGIPSPLAMQTNMADFLAKLGIGNNNEERPRPLAYRKRISREAVSYAMSAGADTNSLKAPSKVMKVEDLYHYPVKQFSSKRGATVAFPLFSVEVPYQTVYTWDIPVTATYSSSAHLGDNDSLVNIWHCIRLENTSNTPWTNGVVELISKKDFAGQGVIPFTAAGESATIPITLASDIMADHSEKVVERRREDPVASAQDKKQTQDQTSSLQQTQVIGVDPQYKKTPIINVVYGSIELRNLSKERKTLEITKKILGTAQSASEGGICETLARPGSYSNNPESRIKWKVDLPGGGAPLTLTYIYRYQE